MGRTSTPKHRSPELVRVVPTAVPICRREGPQQVGDSHRRVIFQQSHRDQATVRCSRSGHLISIRFRYSIGVPSAPSHRTTPQQWWLSVISSGGAPGAPESRNLLLTTPVVPSRSQPPSRGRPDEVNPHAAQSDGFPRRVASCVSLLPAPKS